MSLSAFSHRIGITTIQLTRISAVSALKEGSWLLLLIIAALSIPLPNITMSVLVRPVSLIIGALCYRACLTPPTPPPESVDKVYKAAYTQGVFEKFVRALSFMSRTLVVAMFLCDLAVTLALAYPREPPTAFFRNMCPSPPSNTNALLSVSFPFIVGLALCMSATALRLWCYRTLGRFFTFEVTLKPAHTLVTEGPYAYTRHPSYTGIFIIFVGVWGMLFSENGWIRQCGVMSSPMGLGVRLWLCIAVWTVYGLWQRTRIEDKNLRQRFGKVWDSYARDVPYRLIPGLY
ncbi:hypothetical protein HGRIS_010348 [Hohenbuehelia grisea]|uniref:Protein-S-isoprenylcysteine O-methyltransferase n=1 Tax=Hohenbuehelia grisea TaxID=104357 RepID=A0ABR3J430_9AGAR